MISTRNNKVGKFRKNQNGFSAIEAVLILVILGIVGFTGYFVWHTKQNTDKSLASNNSTAPVIKKQSTTKTSDTNKIDTSIHEVDIKMQTEADISNLPDYTPASFKAYISNILKNNTYSHNDIDDVDTITQYQVSKISQVNIIGGQVPVDKTGQGHAGGAPAIWVLTPGGAWDQETLNGPVCKSKNGGLIYEEFEKECYPDSNSSTMVKNPNGSINSINN
jgi:hypothetical protein